MKSYKTNCRIFKAKKIIFYMMFAFGLSRLLKITQDTDTLILMVDLILGATISIVCACKIGTYTKDGTQIKRVHQ